MKTINKCSIFPPEMEDVANDLVNKYGEEILDEII